MDACSKLLSSRKIWEDGPLNSKAIVNSVRSLLYHQKLTDILKEIQRNSPKNGKKYPPLAEGYQLKPSHLIVETISNFILGKAELQGCKIEQVATLSCLDTLKNVLLDKRKIAPRNVYSIAILSEENRKLIQALVMVMNKLYCLDKFDLRSFANVYYQMESIPLEILWQFHEASLIDSNSYIIKNLCRPPEISKLTSSMSDVICYGGEDEVAKKVCVGLLSPLIAVVYGVSTDTTSSNLLASHKQALKIVLSSILRKVNEQLLSVPLRNQVSQSSVPDDGEIDLKPVNIFHLITLQPDVGGLQSPIIVGFLSNQLADLLTFSPDITLNQAFSYQGDWSFCKIPQHLQQMLTSMLRPFEAKNALDTIRTILKMGEVNWRNVLACISVFSVIKDESGLLMKEFVSSLVYEAFNDSCRETLILALLTARQCSLEDCGFPSYAEWFESMFGVRGTWGKQGDQKGTPSSRNFRLLLSLMSDLVPVESIIGLRAHIAHPPQVPPTAASRTMLSDYLLLARTRLSDFGVRVSDQGGLFRTSQLSTSEVNAQNQNLAAAEVDFVLTHFERTGEILRTVLEASVFRKRYLEQTFLPELLKPRVLPEEPDVRMKVIQMLTSKGLISAAMLKEYNDLCEEERRKPDNGDPGQSLEIPDCLTTLTTELQNHIQIIKRMRSEEVAISSKQMWRSLKESLSTVNQALQKVFTSFPENSIRDTSLEGTDRNVFNSLALMDSKNFSQNEQVISVFLCAWERGLPYFSTSEKIQWLQLMLGVTQPGLMFTLYQHLYQLFAKPSLEVDHSKVDLAVSIALCLHTGALEFPSVSLSSSEELNGSQEDMMSERKVVSILDFLSLALPVSNRNEIEHTFVLCETFLSAVDNLFPSIGDVESKTETVSNLPHLLISKYLFLLKRYHHADLNHSSSFNHSLSKTPEIWQEKFCKSEVQLKQWLSWELLIDPLLDIFNSITSKKDYLLHCFLNFCLKHPTCNVLSIVNDTLAAIVSSWSSENSLSESSSSFLLQLSFQEFIAYKLECFMCSSSEQQNLEVPWLLSLWVDLKREEIDVSLSERKENADWVLLRIVNTLPTYLILKNDAKMKDSDVVKDTVVVLINNYLKQNLCEGGFLPLSFMMYLLGGIIDYHSEPEATVNYLIKMCPSFKMALLAHHVQLQSKLQKLKDSPHLRDLSMIHRIMEIDGDSAAKIPLAIQSADWEVALTLWAKKKAKFPTPQVVTNKKIVNDVPAQICQWILYFDMLSLGWIELFRGKCVNTSDLSLLKELMLQQPSLAKSLDAFHLAKQSRTGPHDHCPMKATVSVAHSTCKVLMSLLSHTQPEEQIAAWMTLLRAVLSARIQWGTYAEKNNLRFELELDRDLRSILSRVLEMVTSKNMSLSEQLPSVYLSGLDKSITKGILIP